ncbi:MAG: lipopolysaccharide biosynthesis protein [Pirellulales bacterium]|nr:lipopolysaccharide biosynthesis protein [Pirellulales bacterium]
MHASAATAKHPIAEKTGSPWRRIWRDTAWVSGSTLVGQAFGAVTSLLLRVLLDPAQIGLWQGVRLVVNYGNLSNLGVSRGASREMTIALGRGDAPAAARSANLAFTVNTISSAVCGAALLCCGSALAFTSTSASGRAWGAALVVAGLLCVVQRFLTYQVTVLRAHQRFATTATVTVLEAALTLLICGVAAALGGLTGLYLGSLVVGLICAAYVTLGTGSRPMLAWDRVEMRRLLAVGFPILLAALANQLFRSLDRLTILMFMPDRELQLGLYSAALLATGQMFGVANALATVMGPRYGEILGRTGHTRSVAALAALASGQQTALLAVIGAMAIVLGAPLLGLVLPEYRTGLLGLPWLVGGTIALGIALPASQYLITIDRQRALLRIVLASVVVGAGLNLVAIFSGHGIAALALAVGLGQTLYAVLVVRYSFWVELAAVERRHYLERVILPAVVLFAAAWALQVELTAPIAWLSVAWRSVVMIAVAAGVLGLAWRPRRAADEEFPQSNEEWRARCHKPGADHLGNSYARWVARPVALQVTRLVAPWGLTAHQATGLALVVAIAAAGCLAVGTPSALLAGAVLLQLWYVLDHVDGQLARFRRTASLDGVQLDYLMHHVVHLLVPLGLGWGVFRTTLNPVWMAAGLLWGLGLLCLGLWHDARYKAFVQRLKWVEGELIVRGAGGCAPQPPAAWPREPHRWPGHLVRKLCEMHVLMLVLGLVALLTWATGDRALLGSRVLLGCLAPVAALLAVAVVVRDLVSGHAEREFADWYGPPAGSTLRQDGSRWRVDAPTATPPPKRASTRGASRV